jgi:hypothetical protein
MRRIVLLLLLAGLVLTARPAEAFHGRHCWGGGWGGCGYGGWGGYGGYGCGYGGWGGCYSPGYSAFYSPYGYGGYGGGYGIGYGGTYLFGQLSPYGTYYNPQANVVQYNLPPVYQPAEIAYGPSAVKQFLGLPRNYAQNPVRQAAPALPIAPRVAAKPAVRVANAESRARAELFVAQGDKLFREQQYHSAVQKYKLAAEAAPDYAEAYWREGHALAASNRFELAATCFKRALAIDGDIRRGGFQLDSLYDGALLSKHGHLEALAADALAHETSADPYFSLGVFLQYDGQPERAAKFFRKAAELSSGDISHLAHFVAPAAERRPATVPVSRPDLEI